jgi:hypothetical protein
MRYYTEKPKDATSTRRYTYRCDHPLYSACTLIRKDELGLAIIQQRFNGRLKIFWYGPIESWLVDEIVAHPGFESYFVDHAEKATDGLYPTVEIRRLMWALRMKPLEKAAWESQLLQRI